MTNILGLDISTSCTGWSILQTEGSDIKGVQIGSIDLKKKTELMDKSITARDHLHTVVKQYLPEYIFVEENAQAFRPGASSAQTLMKLAKFNGIVSYVAYCLSGVTPVNINVTHARKILGIKVQREKLCGVSTKDQVHSWVCAHPHLTNYPWPTRTMTRGPRKGQEVKLDSVYDMSDAFVIALAGHQKLVQNQY